MAEKKLKQKKEKTILSSSKLGQTKEKKVENSKIKQIKNFNSWKSKTRIKKLFKKQKRRTSFKKVFPGKKEKLAKQARRTRWAPVWVVLKKFGPGKKIHPSAITKYKRSWRRGKLHIRPRRIRSGHYG